VSVLFPKSFNAFPTIAAVAAVGGLTTAVAGFWYYATPKFWAVGYMPTQPATGFSHQIHAGKLGMDCRYCHTNVEKSPEANIPSVSTCYGCHAETRLAAWQTQRVGFVREAYAKNESIEWRRVHKVPDYVRNFPHHIHVAAGVSCFSCHGQITAMPIVYQAQSLSMSWCLDCHRNPEQHLVPKDKVTQLVWVENHLKSRAANDPAASAEAIKVSLERQPPQGCGACHY
jgi:hypothetical protein